MLAEGLLAALERAGHEAEAVRLPFKWYPPNAIPPQILAARMLDVSGFSGTTIDRVIGLKFPSYLIPHPAKSLWILHQHRAAYDLWDSGDSDLLKLPMGREVRDYIASADERYIPEAQRVFTISKNVSRRLRHYNGLDSEAMYHPPYNADGFVGGEFRDYLFFPSRINPIKRQWLVIDALAESRVPMTVIFVGSADNPQILDQLMMRAERRGVSERVRWLGPVDEKEKIALYANACGVLYPPFDEDYGYVTLEAMLARKPLITCLDSGGPLEFVDTDVSGLVTEPTPKSLACAMERLWDDRAYGYRLGSAARESYATRNISWANVVERLCDPSRAAA